MWRLACRSLDGHVQTQEVNQARHFGYLEVSQRKPATRTDAYHACIEQAPHVEGHRKL